MGMIFVFDEADIFKSKSLGPGRQTLHNCDTPSIQNVPSYSLVTFVMESFELVRGSSGNKDSGGGVTLRVQLATQEPWLLVGGSVCLKTPVHPGR